MTTQRRPLTPSQRIERAEKRAEKAALGGIQRQRRIAHGHKTFFHRTKNGIYDPITYFHIVHALLNFPQSDLFRTRDFCEYLRTNHQQLAWDVTTVGRILNDLADTFEEVNGKGYLDCARRYDGMVYVLSPSPETRAALLHLLDDLFILSEKLIELELAAQAPARDRSPLHHCASLTIPGSLAV